VSFRANPEHLVGEEKTRVETTGETRVEMPVKTPGKILAILKVHPEYTLEIVAAEIGRSLSAVERAAAKLTKEGKLRHVGPSKAGHWEVIE
jgi:predicted HTH transcriptional regulator